MGVIVRDRRSLRVLRAAAAVVFLAAAFAPRILARRADLLTPVGAVPAYLAGRFREPVAFQQSSWGQYYVFDRRGHTVYGIDNPPTSVWDIATIGAEPGKIIDPTAFSLDPDSGAFVVADAPNNRERIQIFNGAGTRIGGFFLPGRLAARVTLDNVVFGGINSLVYTGRSILMSLPEMGGLISEFTLQGGVARTFGALRETGHEQDRDLHLALNTGIPLVDPTGGVYFVFQTGEPIFRKYDRTGKLLFERRIQGREIDPVIASLPTEWPRRQTSEGELPLVRPTIRTAAVDRSGNLWVTFVVPYTYVFDPDGDEIRIVQFSAAGFFSPTSLFFASKGRLLVTPGLHVFSP